MEDQSNKPQYTVARRLSKELAKDGFTTVPSLFLEYYNTLNVSSSEAILVVHLLSHKWTEKNPFPTFDRLAKRMGMSPTAVRNHARSLEKKGLVKRIHRVGRSNEYDLAPLFRVLESLGAKKKSEAIRKANS